MKFECSAQELHTGLAHVTRALSSRPAMQILEGVLIHAEDDEVELLCSDGSLSIKCRVPAQVSRMGDVVQIKKERHEEKLSMPFCVFLN